MSTIPNIDSAIHIQHLEQLLHKGYSSQLLFCDQLPPSIQVPALISCRMYFEATVQLLNQESNSPLHLLWLVVSSYMIQSNYQEYYQKLKAQKEQKYKQLADDWIKMNKPFHHPPEVKALLRKKFEELLLLGQQQNYFTNPRMPVFLVSCKWLQNFYNDNLSYIPAVDNSDLFSSMHWIETDPKYMHYNYQLKQSCRQNIDYKIVSFEAWQFLSSNFGGMQFRRFTTNEKEPICQLSLNKIKIVVVQNRYVIGFQVFQILASRFDTIALIIERIKRIMISYGIIEFQSLKSSWQPVLISHLPIEQFIDIIQDEDKDIIKLPSDNTFQMLRLQYDHDIEDSQYNYNSDLILFNLQKNKKSFIDMFSIPYKKTTKKYNTCLTCNTTQKLQQCMCKQVYFCCKQCRMKNKQHLKNCQNLMKQESIIARLVDFYEVHKRKFQFNHIKNGGKVGLENLGNTCYMNAALQCVLSIDALNQFFVSNQHAKQLNVTNVLGSQGHLTCAYGELVKDYYVTNRRSLQPIKILKIISSKNAQFRGYNHQDSQQFFNYFFDKLHEDLNRVRDKPYIQNIQSDGRPDEIISQLSWRNYLKRNNSFISDNFAGQYRSEIRCPDCERISITFDPFLSLTFQFPKQVPTIQIIGYFLSNQGQFIKVKEKVNSLMNSGEFVQKYFNQPVIAIWLKNKQPESEWKMKKNLGSNDGSKKILAFYPKLSNCNVQIVYKYSDYDILHRKIFVQEIKDQEHLIRTMYQQLKFPILKATKKQQLLKISLQSYLKSCEQYKFLEFVQKQQVNYPVKEGKIKIKLKIVQQKLPPAWASEQKLKFDVSIRTYQPKSKIRTPRSIDDELTIQDLIQSFSEPEELTEENSWYCNKCKGHKLAQKIMSIYKVPKFLIIHLKRFNHRGNRYIIYGEKVKTPVKLFLIETINGQKYGLFGVVNHYGNLSMGHYTAFVKRDEGWFYADDSSFKRKQPDGTAAYLLFYKRID